MNLSPALVAGELLEVVPPVMRTIRKKWKKGPICGVTNPQFRMLMFIQKNPGASLLDAAHHLGLTSPTTSTMVEDLVSKQLVLREPSSRDRRMVMLTLTDHGQKTLEEVLEHSRSHLSGYLSPLTPDECGTIYAALKLLAPLFSAQSEAEKTSHAEGEKT